jgi:hypothetical protein
MAEDHNTEQYVFIKLLLDVAGRDPLMIQQEISSISMKPPTGPGIMPRERNLIPVRMMVLKTKRH